MSAIFKISGDEVDDKNLKGDLLHLTFSLSEGNIFWGRGSNKLLELNLVHKV